MTGVLIESAPAHRLVLDLLAHPPILVFGLAAVDVLHWI